MPVWAVPRGTEGVRIMTQAVAGAMSVADCLAGTGCSESTLADEDAEIWAHQEFRVVANIVNRLGDRPGLGVDVGGFSTLGRLGEEKGRRQPRMRPASSRQGVRPTREARSWASRSELRSGKYINRR